ncbi:alpha/beta hydrolase [Paenibacillus sp. FSL K6-1230]|uniref:alpha/beta hydrolase n=1 Tax=Paenibacillus sp. FSL K6-1230 TaxID=2921603 RepID=UPI0030FC1AE4
MDQKNERSFLEEGKYMLIHHRIGDYSVAVYAPPTCLNGQKSAPVLYVQDGDTLLPDGLESLGQQYREGQLPHLILVGIQPLNRLDEYSPWHSPALAEGRPAFGGKANRYLSFITGYVRPYIEARYPVMAGPRHTGIMGASLGGLVSMYAVYRHPEIFGHAATLSGSYWYPGFVDFMQSETWTGYDGRYYMSVGSKEGEGKHTIQKDMLPLTIAAHDTLLQRGASSDRTHLEVIPDAVHGHEAFVKQFPSAVAWLLEGMDS